MFKKILLAADGSIHSLKAAEKALELAILNEDTKVYVIYAVDSKTSKEDVLHNWNTFETEYKRKRKMAFIEKEAQKHQINYEIKITRGEPGPTIVKYANENDFDLVVIGSRGLSKMQAMVLGSVSHYVTRKVKCSILLIK